MKKWINYLAEVLPFSEYGDLCTTYSHIQNEWFVIDRKHAGRAMTYECSLFQKKSCSHFVYYFFARIDFLFRASSCYGARRVGR